MMKNNNINILEFTEKYIQNLKLIDNSIICCPYCEVENPRKYWKKIDEELICPNCKNKRL